MRVQWTNWKRGLAVLFVLTLAALSSPAGGAPDGGGAGAPAKTGEKKAEGELPLLMTFEDYHPIAVSDPRFVIRNLNFDRRYAPTGLGEFLDVVFDIQNLTAKDLNLAAYVMAFAETDAVDERYRAVIPFPSWRKYDRMRDRHLVRFGRITGQDGLNIDEVAAQVWDKTDPDFLWARHRIALMRDSAAIQKPIDDVYPPIWKFINYFFFNPTSGLNFKLYGNVGPEEAQAIQTNFIRPTHKEQSTRIFENISRHTYTLEHSRQKTTFRSHHYSEFRPNYKFFNRVAIMIFDADRAAEFQKGMQPLIPRKKDLQLKRMDLNKRLAKAEADEDLNAVAQLNSESLNLRREEEKLATEVRNLRTEHNHLAFKKTYSMKELKVY